jgi:serine/threonine protein kinase
VSAASGATGGGLRLENTKAAGLKLTLHVLHRILLGVSNVVPLGPAHQHLLFHQLIPLHRVEGMVLWRDQMAVLELYHEPLVQCIAVLLQKQPVWIPNVLMALLQQDIFPATGNTPKQVLLLHEIDTYLGLLDNDKVEWEKLIHSSNISTASSSTSSSSAAVASGTAWIQSLLQVTSRCMASDHSRVSERALALFKNKQFELIVQYKLEAALAFLLPALVRTEPSWNPTVRKMTYHVLTKVQAYDAEAFERVSNRIFSAGPNMPSAVSAAPVTTAAAPATSSLITTRPDQAVPPSGLSLKAGMGSWRPPSSAAHSRRGAPGSMMPPPSIRPRSGQAQPPATVTGVAPWAHTNTSASSAIPTQPGNGGPSSKAPRLPPPSTVTGVAPWAMQPFPGATTPKTASTAHKRRAPSASLPPTTELGTDVSEESNGSEEASPTGLDRVLAYMKKIQPPEEEEGVSTWSMAQMAETPTLLPKLKFHDLVFGHDLGAGAFGSVKYARLIERTKTRSHWAEYAVKVVSTEKIRELGYEASIQREIAVLRILSHPGIARLVSSFRFQEGAYLVLEYASGGDLHTLLRKHGSLDHDSARFVIGEVVAALASIHDIGLVYADLKPENIVITETGHLKLTDFGGCRPVTEKAKEKTRLIAKGILKNLRDGNWKEQAAKPAEDGNDPVDEDDVTDHEEDVRIEGTTAYLPPEVVMGSFPTTAADSWALGCVLYQCLSGRPPLLEADEDSTRNRIVSFDVHESTNQVDRLFQDTHASAIRADARELIKSLLEREASKRPGMHQTAQHDFFTKAEVDVFSLHRKPAYPLDVGDVSPSPDAQWARRQFSSIWAPQPVSYNISLPDEDATFTYYDMSRTGPIAEGEEALGFFSTGASGHLPTKLGHISERAPMHSS